MSQLCASSGIQSKHLIMMPISEESAFTKPVWCSIAGHFCKRTINSRIPTLFGAPLETLACESEAAATVRFRSRVSHSPTYASRIFYHCPTAWLYAICGKATQLSAGKSERQLCTPSLVPSKSRLLSYTSDLLPSRFSFLFIEPSHFLSYSRKPFGFWRVGVRFV